MRKIVIIGAGNLATHLTFALQKADFQIKQIYSRTLLSAKTLADKINAGYTTDLKKLYLTADLYIIAVSDSAIELILKNKNLTDKFIVHTAGSIDMDILKNSTKNYGIFYPLQSI